VESARAEEGARAWVRVRVCASNPIIKRGRPGLTTCRPHLRVLRRPNKTEAQSRTVSYSRTMTPRARVSEVSLPGGREAGSRTPVEIASSSQGLAYRPGRALIKTIPVSSDPTTQRASTSSCVCVCVCVCVCARLRPEARVGN
jgi:hypothetical protein